MITEKILESGNLELIICDESKEYLQKLLLEDKDEFFKEFESELEKFTCNGEIDYIDDISIFGVLSNAPAFVIYKSESECIDDDLCNIDNVESFWFYMDYMLFSWEINLVENGVVIFSKS